jgi:hypothetical protein
MAGAKQAFEFELTNDQMAFIRSAKDRYNIPDESKVLRIVVDYLLSNPDSHVSVFTEPRCLRCD